MARILQDADFALQKYTDDIPNIKRLQATVDDLKKMKLSKNAEKIEEIVRTVYLTIESMEETFLSKLPDTKIAPGSNVAIPFFVSIYDKRKRAKKMHEIGVHLDITERFYAHIGRAMVMATLMTKEIRALMQQQWGK